MSYRNKGSVISRLLNSVSIYSFAQNFLLNTMAGQKLFLFGGKLPRVINVSFNEKTCMFKCRMCPYSVDTVRDMYKKKSEMEFETFKKLVASIPNDPYYNVDISAIGESLEYRDLGKCLRYLSEQKSKVNSIISTNAVLLKGKMVDDILTSGLKNIQMSLYDGDKERHQFVTQTKAYDRVVENIKNFYKRREELGLTSDDIFIQVFMLGTKENQHLIEKFHEDFSPYCDKTFVRPIYNMGEEIIGMTPDFEPTPIKNRYPCITPWYSTSVRSNGDVLACYAFNWHKEEKDSMVVGNINEQTLEQIYSSENMQRFREDHLKQNLDPHSVCQKCDLWSAYSNVWDRDDENNYVPSKLTIKDFFTPAPNDYRGG